MANYWLLAAVAVCTLGGLLFAIPFAVFIWRVIGGVDCPSELYESLGLVLIFLCIFLWIILSLTCRALWRGTKYGPISSYSMMDKILREYDYEMPTRYSFCQLNKITNNFAEKLGEGGYGVVYKGKLQNGNLVAVKLLDRHWQSEAKFLKEVATIGHVHHVNLVRLLGYCFESFTSALVYEFMVNGSLDKFISVGKDKGQGLSWEQLYSIALSVARGISFLHKDCYKRIIHLDIKPQNILLDTDYTPKVSDFGLAKLCVNGDGHISMMAGRESQGYVAPEVCDRNLGPVTDKSDVHTFGMLLLEIVGGRKNLDVQSICSCECYFSEWIASLIKNGELGIGFRGEIESEDEEIKAIRVMTKIGVWCIQYNSTDRPSMANVVQMLETNGDEVANPPFLYNISSSVPEIGVLSTTEESSIEILTS